MTHLICEKIKTARKSQNLTQEDLAEKLNLSLNAYGKIERGETDVPISRLEQIANVLDMSVIELLTFGEKQIIYSSYNVTTNHHKNSNNKNNKNLYIYDNLSTDQHILTLNFEIEKLTLQLEHKNQEIQYLKQLLEHKNTLK